MAKSGFAVSDRKKVEVLSADKTIEPHDCGTVFLLNLATAHAITLPTAAKAGEGWWCRFISSVAQTHDVTITFGATVASGETATLLEVSTDGAEDVWSLGGGGTETLVVANAADTIGDEAELVVANGVWWIRAISKS